MVKSYLRYQLESDFGAVLSKKCNIEVNLDSSSVYTSVNQFVYSRNLKSGEVDLKYSSISSNDINGALCYATCITQHPIVDEMIAVGYNDGSIRLWNSQSVDTIIAFHGHSSAITALEFSLSEHTLISGSEDTSIIAWDIISHSGLFRLQGHHSRITAICLLYTPEHYINYNHRNKDEAKLSRNSDQNPLALKKRKKTHSHTFNIDVNSSKINANKNPLSSFVFMKRDKFYIASASHDGTIKLWDFLSQSCIQTIFDPSNDICSLAADNVSGFLFAGTGDRELKVYRFSCSINKDKELDGEYLSYYGQIKRPKKKNKINRILHISDTNRTIEELVKHGSDISNFNLSTEKTYFMTKWGTVLTGVSDHAGFKNQGRILLVACLHQNNYIEVYRQWSEDKLAYRRRKHKRRIAEKLKSKLSELTLKESLGAENEVYLSSKEKPHVFPTIFDIEACKVQDKLFGTQNELELLKKVGPEHLLHNNHTTDDQFEYLFSFTLIDKPTALSYCTMKNLLVISFNNALISYELDLKGILEWKTKNLETNIDNLFRQRHSIINQGHVGPLRGICMSHDDSVIATIAGTMLFLWRADTSALIRHIDLKVQLTSVIFIVGNCHIVVGTNQGELVLVDLVTLSILQSLRSSFPEVTVMVEHPKKTGFVVGGPSKLMQFYKFFMFDKDNQCDNSQIRMALLESHELSDNILALKYSSNKLWLAVALLDFNIQVFFADTLKLHLTLYGHSLPCTSLDISSDSIILATGSYDKTIKIWNMQFGNIEASLQTGSTVVTCVVFLNKTHYLVSAGSDALVKFWDVDTRELISQYSGQCQPILFCISTHLDSDRIITGGNDGLILIWRRTREQIFIEEENEKLLEGMLDKELNKSCIANRSSDFFMSRPTRKCSESIQSTELLMETIDLAYNVYLQQCEYRSRLQDTELLNSYNTKLSAEQAMLLPSCPLPDPKLNGMSPEHFIFEIVTKCLPSSVSHEVIIALPFSFAEKLLELLSHVVKLIGDASSNFVAMHGTETVAKVILLTIHCHVTSLANSREHQQILYRIYSYLKPILRRMKDEAEFTRTAINFLGEQASLKCAIMSE